MRAGTEEGRRVPRQLHLMLAAPLIHRFVLVESGFPEGVTFPTESALSIGTKRRIAMSTGMPASVAKPGVSKIVKLGEETLLITQIENGDAVAEGPIDVRAIEAVPVASGPSGAICGGFSICGIKSGDA